MAAVSEFSMSKPDREFLRKKTGYLIQNLLVDDILLYMTNTFDQNSEDLIKAESTRQRKIQKFLDLLPRMGGKAFNAFLVAANQVQDWLARHLAQERGVDLNAILQEHSETAAGEGGMNDVHRQILRQHMPDFLPNPDPIFNVDEMVTSLREANIIKLDHHCQKIVEKQTYREQVEELFQLLPRLGPNAFDAFFNALKNIQPQFFYDIKQKIDRTHPGIIQVIGTGKCYPESSNDEAVHQNYNLSTLCSELPKKVLRLVEEDLNKPDEVLENDWKRLYKVFKLPEGRMNVLEKCPNPTESVIDSWKKRDGRQATIQKLLEALTECEQGALVHKIQTMLKIELKQKCDVVDAVERMCVEDEKRNKAIRTVKDIPQELKVKFMNNLSGLEQDVLSDVASAVMEERCYVCDAEDFLEKLGEQKMRILFRELRKANQPEITQWMRKKFPAGSTGPVKSDDELRPSEMLYGHRLEVTNELNAKDLWRKLASHKDLKMSATEVALLEQRTKDRADAVLSTWEVSRKSTVGTMYDFLVDCGLNNIADLL